MFAKTKPLSCLLSVILVFLFILTGCASNAASSGPSALKTGPGVDNTAKTITLGILSPQSGGAIADLIGIPLANGVKTFFAGINGQGGIGGYQIKFVEKDTQYNPQLEVTHYNEIHNQVLMIADSLGTPTTFAIKDQASADHMLVSAATLSSALAREKYLMLAGTPYRLQVENAFDYVVNTLHVAHPATGIIYQNDEYGQDGLTGYKEAIAAYGLNDVGQASYGATDTKFTAQVLQLKAAGAKYVFLTSIPGATGGIIGTAAALGYTPQWILQSPAFATPLMAVPALAPLMSKAWVMGQGPVWGDTSAPGMVQLLADVAKYAPTQKPDAFFQAGYTYAKVTYAVLKQAFANNDISRDGLLKAFESLKNVDLGGLLPPVNYGSSADPNSRVPTRDSVVFAIDATQPTDIKALTPDFTGTAAKASQF
ncbi:MAG: ABC transporter substrate-binding protein [Ktedonobacteraceae bacterium]